jgi:hypothetical protein
LRQEVINPSHHQVLPSAHQEKNLTSMAEILSGNWKAKILAQSLWEFFRYQIYCTIRDDDGKPNRYRIDGIHSPEKIDDIRIAISLRRNERLEEALVHELLHLNLIPMGYPRFWIDEERGSDKCVLAGGMINLADHEVMQPTYLSLGYSEDRFLGKSRTLTKREGTLKADFSRMPDELRSPLGYLTRMSACLESQAIKFRPLHIANAIAKRNGWLI